MCPSVQLKPVMKHARTIKEKPFTTVSRSENVTKRVGVVASYEFSCRNDGRKEHSEDVVKGFLSGQ